MKTPRMANSVGHIDDDLIAAAAECKKKKKNNWMKWGSLAACFAILVIAGAAILPSLLDGNTPGGTDDRYKDHFIQAGESAIIWPWEYQTVYEQYTRLELDGIEYRSQGRAVSEEYVSKRIGTHTVTGYDEYAKDYHVEEFDVYQLKHADNGQYVAVKMQGAFYVFKNDKYDPPSTLGELFELIALPKVIELNRFSENGDGPSDKHFALTKDDYIWEVLADCEDAAFVEDDRWTTGDREYLSFTVTSETLGVYKVVMYVTTDGYLWTNAFNFQYLFDIGEDVAGEIIKYAKENSTEAEYEPYRNAVAGTITEITEEYIFVSDAVLCNDPADGITYKILLNDLRISRYVDRGIVEVGDTVQISYEGEISDDNTIDNAISVSKVKISGGDVLIPE